MRLSAFWAVIPVAALVIACGAGSTGKDTKGPGAQGAGSAASAAASKGPKHTIALDVTGPKAADVTYGLNGDQSQDNGAALPWHKDLTSNEDFYVVSVVAQSKGTGEIACRITVDGKLVKENKSTGQYAVVTCTNS
jgi:hypothetical protein